MKKLLLLTVLLSLTVSCSNDSKKECFLENAISKIKEDMNDPESFEFISFEKTDSITIGKLKENANSDRLKEIENIIEKLPDDAEMLRLYESTKKQIALIDIKKDSPNDVGMYKGYINARGNNALGAKIKTKYFVAYLNDGACTVLRVKEE